MLCDMTNSGSKQSANILVWLRSAYFDSPALSLLDPSKDASPLSKAGAYYTHNAAPTPSPSLIRKMCYYLCN